MKLTQLARRGLAAAMRSSLPVASALAWAPASSPDLAATLGSCYENALTTHDGSGDAQVQGVGCPHDLNRVRWFAHPDGSPDGLGWAH